MNGRSAVLTCVLEGQSPYRYADTIGKVTNGGPGHQRYVRVLTREHRGERPPSELVAVVSRLLYPAQFHNRYRRLRVGETGGGGGGEEGGSSALAAPASTCARGVRRILLSEIARRRYGKRRAPDCAPPRACTYVPTHHHGCGGVCIMKYLLMHARGGGALLPRARKGSVAMRPPYVVYIHARNAIWKSFESGIQLRWIKCDILPRDSLFLSLPSPSWSPGCKKNRGRGKKFL